MNKVLCKDPEKEKTVENGSIQRK